MIYVTTPGKLRSFPADARWVYLGGDVEELAAAADHFGPERRIVLGRTVAKRVDELRGAVNDAVARIGTRQTDMVSWWACELAHRSRGGDVLLLTGFVAAFGSIRADVALDGRKATVVIVEDPWCFATIREAFGSDPRIVFTNRAADWLRWRTVTRDLLGSLFARVFGVGSALFEKVYFGLFSRSPLHSAESPAGMGVVWNFAFVEARLFTKGGGLQDPYLPRIQELAEGAGRRLRRFTNLLFPVRFYSIVAKNQDSMEVMIRHVRLWDILRSAVRIPPFRPTPGLMAGDIPLAHLIRREWWREFRSRRLMTNALWYAACRRFLRQPAVGSSSVFFWWENQPWNKLICLAGDGSPGERPWFTGYQHCALSANQLNFFPSEIEIESVPMPDVIFTNGRAAHQMLLDAGYPPARLKMAGNMRLSYEGRRPPIREDSPFSASVYLPCDLLVAQEMMVALVTNDQVWRQNGVRFLLHPHPDVPFSLIGLGPDDAECLVAGKHSVRECVGKVDIMICSNTGVSLEGLALGVPVVSYVPERALWMDAAADNYPAYVAICGSDDFVETVLDARDRWSGSPEPPTSWRHAAEIFPPWDRSGWLERALPPSPREMSMEEQAEG